MRSLLETPAPVHSDSDAPAAVEPTAPYTADDAAWWAGEQTGGCHPDDLSPEDRLIATAMTALAYHLDQCGEEYEAASRYEAGHGFC